MKASRPSVRMTIADYITRQIDIQTSSGKSQREIAAAIGYEKPNILSMFKSGDAKIPLDKIPKFAKALNVDAAFLFRLAIQQYWADDLDTVAEIFGTVLTKNERDLIEYVRHVSKEEDPPLTADIKRKVKEAYRDT
jgi:transcriptional regulator with XRE-family HTH domain